MGKIFKITGNYVQYGMWAIPDPSFAGEVILCDDGYLRGYCNELYESEQPDENKLRFIFGKFGVNKKSGKDGFVFYKLSNYEMQSPLLYDIQDFEDQSENYWSALRCTFGSVNFTSQGAAKVTLEEIEYSEERAKAILAKYHQIEDEDNLNDSMLTFFDEFASQLIE